MLKITSLPIPLSLNQMSSPWPQKSIISQQALGFLKLQTLAAAFPHPHTSNPTKCTKMCEPQSSSLLGLCWDLCYICFIHLTTFPFFCYQVGLQHQCPYGRRSIPKWLLPVSTFPGWAAVAFCLSRRLFKVSKKVWPRLLSNHCFCPRSQSVWDLVCALKNEVYSLQPSRTLESKDHWPSKPNV